MGHERKSISGKMRCCREAGARVSSSLGQECGGLSHTVIEELEPLDEYGTGVYRYSEGLWRKAGEGFDGLDPSKRCAEHSVYTQ